MRILFLNSIGRIGGAERVLLTAIACVKRHAPDTVVGLILPTAGTLAEAAQALGVEVQIVPLPKILEALGDSQARGASWGGKAVAIAKAVATIPAVWGYSRRLKAAVNRFRPNLVHSNSIKTHLLSRFAVNRRIPVIWHLHDFYGLRPISAGLLRWASGRTQSAIAISNAVAIDAAKVLPRVPIVTIRNAVDVGRFRPGPSGGIELDRQAGMPPAPEGTIRVGLVATYARWKGHLTFLEAARLLAKVKPQLHVRWYVVGGPIYQTAAQFTEAELRSAVTIHAIADRVGVIPFIADPVPLYRTLDIVIHASTLPEPFGLTIAEAMACGRATVVSRAGGAAELCTDGLDALGITPGDAKGMADAVSRLVEDPALRQRIATQARTTAEASFGTDRYGPSLVDLYQKVLATKPLPMSGSIK